MAGVITIPAQTDATGQPTVVFIVPIGWTRQWGLVLFPGESGTSIAQPEQFPSFPAYVGRRAQSSSAPRDAAIVSDRFMPRQRPSSLIVLESSFCPNTEVRNK